MNKKGGLRRSLVCAFIYLYGGRDEQSKFMNKREIA